MAQFTVRLDDRLAGQIRDHAGSLGRSVNSWVVAVLQAAADPDLADTEVERTRARLERAGLLLAPVRPAGQTRPDPRQVGRARRAAGAGTSLSRAVSDGRG